MQDLFASEQSYEPLAARMRPQNLDDFFGQQHLLAPGKLLRKAIEENRLHSMVFWGPPGVGKTTLASLIAKQCDVNFQILSAVFSGVKDVRAAMQQAQINRQQSGKQTILFVDEIHRFNKSQQDAFLPYVEDGTIVFIGATTENPSFEVNNALLSRARVYVLKSLTEDDLLQILQRAINKNEVQVDGQSIVADENLLRKIVIAADGDARRGLNLLDYAVAMLDTPELTDDAVAQVIQGHMKRYDKGGDIFYDQISAFHKSVRGSSPEGALYWYARMLDAGCDPLYVARRLCAIASEDIGNADPRALQLVVNAWDVFERLGPAEGERAIAHAAVYCACAPKSNAVELAFKAAKQLVRDTGSLDVPFHLRNAPTKLMKEMGYGDEYRYAHDEPNAYAAGENYLPEAIKDSILYQPTDFGLESKIKSRLEYLKALDKNSKTKRY
ncbi:MAG: replication-associated recombination protein A [Gammaproteobacteria bacterium]|nr:replication-associated recombination protein A [Gammaproteobacteria bacterium]